MRIKTLMSVVAVVMLGPFASACGTTDYDISSTAPAPYQGQATATGGSLIQQLQKAGPKAKPTIVFAVGACDDKTVLSGYARSRFERQEAKAAVGLIPVVACVVNWILLVARATVFGG